MCFNFKLRDRKYVQLVIKTGKTTQNVLQLTHKVTKDIVYVTLVLAYKNVTDMEPCVL